MSNERIRTMREAQLMNKVLAYGGEGAKPEPAKPKTEEKPAEKKDGEKPKSDKP